MGGVLLGPVLRNNHWGCVARTISPGLGGAFGEVSRALSRDNSVIAGNSLPRPTSRFLVRGSAVTLLRSEEKMRREASHGLAYSCTSTHVCPVGTGDHTIFALMRAGYVNNGEGQLKLFGHSLGLLVPSSPSSLSVFPWRIYRIHFSLGSC